MKPEVLSGSLRPLSPRPPPPLLLPLNTVDSTISTDKTTLRPGYPYQCGSLGGILEICSSSLQYRYVEVPICAEVNVTETTLYTCRMYIVLMLFSHQRDHKNSLFLTPPLSPLIIYHRILYFVTIVATLVQRTALNGGRDESLAFVINNPSTTSTLSPL